MLYVRKVLVERFKNHSGYGFLDFLNKIIYKKKKRIKKENMKLFFNDQFKSKLIDSIENIENNSVIEIVVVIKRISGNYLHVPLLYGIAFFLFTIAWFIFSPFGYDFNHPLVYGIILLSFFLGFLICQTIKPLERLFIKNETMDKNVELKARAIFQKSGMHHTNKKIGTLIYASLFEKKVFLVSDRGSENAIPLEEWKNIQNSFQNVFKTSNLEDEFIKALRACQPIFSKYLPPIENDINELPDFIEVDI